MSLDAARTAVGLQLPLTDHLETRRTALPALRPMTSWALHKLWRIRTHHTHNLPDSGPVILAPNHLATIDGPLIVLLTPNTVALAKNELFASPAAPLLRLSGQIPLSRNYPDAPALRHAIHALRCRKRLAIFPEGRRGAGDFTHIEGGLAYLALVTGAPIIPVAIFGTQAARPDPLRGLPPVGADIDVVYGGALRIAAQPWPRRPHDISSATAMLADGLREHLGFAKSITGRD